MLAVGEPVEPRIDGGTHTESTFAAVQGYS